MILKRQSQPINRKRINNPVNQTMSKSVISQSHVPVSRNGVPLRPISLASIHTNNLPKLPSVNKIKDAVPRGKSRVDSVRNHNETKTYSEFSNNQNIPKRAPSVVCIVSKADRTVKQNAKNEIKVTNSVRDKGIVNGGTKDREKTLTNRSVSRSSLHMVNSNCQNDLRPNSNERASNTSVNMSDDVVKSVNGRKDVVNKDDHSNGEISSTRNARISYSNVTDTEQGEHTQKAHVVEISSPNNDSTYVDEIVNREDFDIRYKVQTHGKPERNGSPRPTQVRSNLRESKGSMPKKRKERLPTTKELKEKTLAHKLEKSRFPDINVNNRTIENASASPKPEIKRSVKYNEVKTETARTVSHSENQGTSKWKDMVQKYLREPYLEVGKKKRLSVFQTEMDTDDSDSEVDIFERARKKYGLNVEDDSDDDDE